MESYIIDVLVVKQIMSGKDERVIKERPQCSRCGLDTDIIVRYINGITAGWILKKTEKELFNAPILISRHFQVNSNPIEAICGGCGYLNVNTINKAIIFFKKETQAKRYITWSEWKELRIR